MFFVISAKDGAFRLQVKARDVDSAMEACAQHFEYASYAEMCEDLNLTGSYFNVVTIIDERAGESYPNQPNLEQAKAGSVLSALKHVMRRKR